MEIDNRIDIEINDINSINEMENEMKDEMKDENSINEMDDINNMIKNILIYDNYNNANIFYNNNNFDEALYNYEKIITILENNKIDDSILISNIYSNISACYLNKKDYMNSLNYSLLSVKYNLKNAKAWGRTGWSYKGLKMYHKALQAFNIALKFNSINNYYKNEILFLEKNILINKSDVFNILLNDKTLYEKIKKKKYNKKCFTR